MNLLETQRLLLRRLEEGDAPFILELLNDPDWLRYIGDRGVHNLEDARRYIKTGPGELYSKHGFGPLLVRLKDGGQSVGTCGLIRRETLDDVDLGFAFLAEYRRMGFGFEAASAVLDYGRNTLGLTRIIALTSPGNIPSARLLEKLGFRFERMAQLEAEGEDLKLYSTSSQAAP